MGFKNRTRVGAVVGELEQAYGFRFCADYREYLSSEAAAVPGDEPGNVTRGLIAWADVSEPGEPMSKAELKTADPTNFYHDIGQVYGLDELRNDFAEAQKEDGDLGFWHLKLLAHAYPVGKSYGGDPIVQVTSGKHAGKIFLTNHEVWYGGFEYLASDEAGEREEFEMDAEDAMEELGIKSLAGLSTDQLIELMKHESLDGNVWLADSFYDFYRNLCRFRGAR